MYISSDLCVLSLTSLLSTHLSRKKYFEMPKTFPRNLINLHPPPPPPYGGHICPVTRQSVYDNLLNVTVSRCHCRGHQR